MVRVSATHNERDEVDLLVAYSARVLQHDRATLRRASKIEGRVTEWHAFRAVQSTSVQRHPVRCSTPDEGIRWGQKRLGARKEREANDIARCKDNEEPWVGEQTCSANEGGLQRDGVMLAASVDVKVEPGRRIYKLTVREGSVKRRGLKSRTW